MHSNYPARRFLLGVLALTATTVTAAAEELYRFTPPPDKEHNSTGKWGHAYDRPYGSNARRDAVKFSKAEDAQVVVVAGNMCCTLAVGDDKDAYGVGTGGRLTLPRGSPCAPPAKGRPIATSLTASIRNMVRVGELTRS